MANAAIAATADYSALLKVEISGPVLSVGLNRPAKRNALNDGIMLAIQDCFSNIPDGVGAVVIHGVGDHFSSGLDLSELPSTTPPRACGIRRCGTGCSTAFNIAACPSLPHFGAP